MADIHILSGNGKNKWTAVFHFVVPSQNNAVGINYRTALINSGIGGDSVMVEGSGTGQIETSELTQVQSGALYEHSTELLIETGGTTVPQLRSMLRNEYSKAKSAILEELQNRLRYFGHTESEA